MPPKSVFKVTPKFSSDARLNSDPLPTPNYADLAKGAYTSADVPGWTKDPRFSSRDRTLYYRTRPDGSREGVLANTGTRLYQGRMTALSDLGHDALLALGLKRLSSRFRSNVKVAKAAVDEYGAQNLTLVGHSLGGAGALHQADQLKHQTGQSVKAVAYNPGLSALDSRRGQYAIQIAEHLMPQMGPARWVWSYARDGPYRLPENAEAHAVKGDSIAAMTPYLDTKHVYLHDKKVRDAHSIANFTSDAPTDA